MSTNDSSVTLDRASSAENWSLTPNNVPNNFPLMFFPAKMAEPDAQTYAVGILRSAGVLLPPDSELQWRHGYGHKSALAWRTTITLEAL